MNSIARNLVLGSLMGIAMFAAGIFTVVVIFMHGGAYRRKADLRQYVSQFKPGMSYQEVKALIPERYFIVTNVTPYAITDGTFIISTSEVLHTALRIRQDWWGGGSATMYFNTNNTLMGIYYNAFHEPWRPSWGHKATSEEQHFYMDKELLERILRAAKEKKAAEQAGRKRKE